MRVEHGAGQSGSRVSRVCGAYLKARIDLDRRQLHAAHAPDRSRRTDRATAGQLQARHAVVEPWLTIVLVLEHPERHAVRRVTGNSLVHLAYEAQPEGRSMMIKHPLQMLGVTRRSSRVRAALGCSAAGG